MVTAVMVCWGELIPSQSLTSSSSSLTPSLLLLYTVPPLHLLCPSLSLPISLHSLPLLIPLPPSPLSPPSLPPSLPFLASIFTQLSSGLQWCVWREGVTTGISCSNLTAVNYVAMAEHNNDTLSLYAGEMNNNG